MDKLCENCNTKKAAVMCERCNAALCPECDAKVHSFGIFKSHVREPIAASVDAAGTCGKHGSRVVAVCDDCKTMCCCECLLSEHVGHHIIDYKDALKRRKDESNALRSDLQMACDVGRLAVEAARKEIAQLEANKRKTLEGINASFERASALLEAKKAKLIESLTKATDAEDAKLRKTCETLEKHVAEANTINSSSSTDKEDTLESSVVIERAVMCVNDEVSAFIKETAPSIETVTFTEQVKEKEKKLKISDDNDDDDDDKSSSSSSSPSSKGDFESIVNAFGSLTITPKYVTDKALYLAKTTDPNTGGASLDIKDESVGLTWKDDTPEVVLSLVNGCAECVFVVEKAQGKEDVFAEVYSGKETSYRFTGLERGVHYKFRVRCCLRSARNCNKIPKEFWATNTLSLVGGGFPGTWKEGPYYTLNEEHTVATKDSSKGSFYGLALGTVSIPTFGVTKWRFVVTKYEGSTACIGVAPEDADQKARSPYENEGYYICTCDAELHSGKPYDYSHKNYGHCKISTGGYVDVIVNMDERTISFNCNGKETGVAYKDIPIDKPLVPAAAFDEPGDAFELTQITSESK